MDKKYLEKKNQRALKVHGATPLKGYYETFRRRASLAQLLSTVTELNLWDVLAFIWAADADLKKHRLFYAPDGRGIDALAFLAKAAIIRSDPTAGNAAHDSC